MSIEEIFQTMKNIVAEEFGQNPDDITMETTFEDLGADSVDLMEVVMDIEEEFDIGEVEEESAGSMKTVGDAVNYIASKLK